MKRFNNKILLLLLMALLVGVSITSCKKDNSSSTPQISYVRYTDPTKSDSLLAAAYMGNLVAIVGTDLGDVNQIWFNDQQATLNPAYVTNTSILVAVPNAVPGTVTNQMKLIFKDGTVLSYSFNVTIPGPILNSIKCEYVPDGGTVVLNGDYYFNPQVFFAGGQQAEIVSFTKTQILVTVPTGAQMGNITVKTKFGTAKSSFIFRDNTNVILDFDTYFPEMWTAGYAYATTNPTPAPCSGNYAFLRNDAVGAWMWTNPLSLQYYAPDGIRGNVPVATGNINDLVFRFEANVPIPWKEVPLEIFFAPYGTNHGRDLPGTAIARWKPWVNGPYTTDGWVTISIPLSDFQFTTSDSEDATVGTAKITNLSSLTNVTMLLFGPAAGTYPVNINIDNIRIVSK